MAPREHIEACGGGILVKSDSPEAISALLTLARDREAARAQGREGPAGVTANRSLRRMAERTLEVYRSL